MSPTQKSNLSEQAKQLTEHHNNQIKSVYVDSDDEHIDRDKNIEELKPILDKIFALPAANVQKSTSLNVYETKYKEYIKIDDPQNISFDLFTSHFKFLKNEKFHIRYDNTDSCYTIRWDN